MMRRSEPWWVTVPIMFASAFLVLFGLKMLQRALPQVFPRIEGPHLPTLALVGCFWIVIFVLIVRPVEPAMNRQPGLRALVTGIGIGILSFVQGLVA